MGEAFRANEINFLQEQNNQILEQLENVENERDRANAEIVACQERDSGLQAQLQAVKDRITVLADRLQTDKAELLSKDEHVKVLNEQNRQMLNMLENEEVKSKGYEDRIQTLEVNNRKLQTVADQFDTEKARLEKELAEAKSRCGTVVAHVKNQRTLNENLRANIQNTEAKTRVDIEALGQALQVVDQKNLEYMTRLGKQETAEQQLKAETETLNEEVEQVRADIDQLRKRLEGDEEGRTSFERARSQLEMSIEALEVQADTLKKALSTAERANEHLQKENHSSSDKCRETADKVYALMDSLRLNQVELKKQEAENTAKDKKINSLERQTQNLQAKIAYETDTRVLAEQERKEAEQEIQVLKRKNKKIEEGVTQSQTDHEKAEKEITGVTDRVGQLQTQNAYLASRIDGQEEEKNSLKAEISKLNSRASNLASENTRLRDQIDRLEEEYATANHEKDQHHAELQYIKREDVLDDAGRQMPILIQSTESDLLEKLQVNEFLYEAQQNRNPIPPLVEKVAQLLAMLHEGQERSDKHLADLSKSNGLVSAMRQRNMALFSRTQMFESFKTRALLRYVMNLVEDGQMSDLHLDGLSFGQREINEMIGLLSRYDATDQVFVVSLVDNALDDDSVNLILQLIFSLPYLRKLDLKRNCITPEGLRRIMEQLKTMEGITTVIPNATGVLNVHSGNQVRVSIDLGEQLAPDQVAREVDFGVHHELSHQDADPFLATNAGKSNHPWTKTLATQRSPQQAIPDPSSTELPRAAGAPQAPVQLNQQLHQQQTNNGGHTASAAAVAAAAAAAAAGGANNGGPPVGLGGPGNVDRLNKRSAQGKDRVPEPKKRQARRAKAAPPPALESILSERYIDKWQSGGVTELPRPTSTGLRAATSAQQQMRSSGPRRNSSADLRSTALPAAESRRSAAQMGRSCSVPALRNGGPGTRRPPLAGARR